MEKGIVKTHKKKYLYNLMVKSYLIGQLFKKSFGLLNIFFKIKLYQNDMKEMFKSKILYASLFQLGTATVR